MRRRIANLFGGLRRHGTGAPAETAPGARRAAGPNKLPSPQG